MKTLLLILAFSLIFTLGFAIQAQDIDSPEMYEMTFPEQPGEVLGVSDEGCDPDISELAVVDCDPTWEVKERITQVAREYLWSPEIFIDLAICETTDLDPDKHGGIADSFHGLFQWKIYIGGLITHECAHDIECSTATTIRALDREEHWRWPNCL